MLYRYCMGAAALLCVVTSEAALAADGSCWLAEEAKAARMQNLQTYLMIHALKCRDTIPGTLESYNAFMNQRRDLMISNKYAVQAHFVRLHGPVDGAAASTNYDTQQGNRLSSSAIDVKNCETAGLYARLAASASHDDLLALAGMLAGSEDLTECPAPAAAPARPTGMVIPVWEKQAPTPPPPADTSMPPAAVSTASVATSAAPTNETNEAPALVNAVVTKPISPAEPAVATKEVAASAPDDRRAALKALEDATVALKQAAAALQPVPPVTAVAGGDN